MCYFSTVKMSKIQYTFFKYFFSRISFFSVIVLAFIFKIVNSQQVSNFALNKKYFGQRLVGHDILTSTESSIGICARKCFQLTHCLSINFNTVSGECDYKSITLNEHTKYSVVQDANYIFSDIQSWPKVSSFINFVR